MARAMLRWFVVPGWADERTRGPAACRNRRLGQQQMRQSSDGIWLPGRGRAHRVSSGSRLPRRRLSAGEKTTDKSPAGPVIPIGDGLPVAGLDNRLRVAFALYRQGSHLPAVPAAKGGSIG